MKQLTLLFILSVLASACSNSPIEPTLPATSTVEPRTLSPRPTATPPGIDPSLPTPAPPPTALNPSAPPIP